LVGGTVAGAANGPLDVYVLAAGRTVGYRTCNAGEMFAIVTDELPQDFEDVRVELVNGAVVWYAAEVGGR